MPAWPTIDSAPKSGRPILVRGAYGFVSVAFWNVQDEEWACVADGFFAYPPGSGAPRAVRCPTHWTEIPPLCGAVMARMEDGA